MTDAPTKGLHPRKLRHAAAMLAIASGADVKVVQQMLGHMSPTTTLNLYGHLLAAQLDTVAASTDAARTESARQIVATGQCC